jgi:hypothetical protein
VLTSGLDFHLVPLIPKAKCNRGSVGQPTLIVAQMLTYGIKYSIIDTVRYYCISSFPLRGLRFNFVPSMKYVGFNYESLALIQYFPRTQIYLNGFP